MYPAVRLDIDEAEEERWRRRARVFSPKFCTWSIGVRNTLEEKTGVVYLRDSRFNILNQIFPHVVEIRVAYYSNIQTCYIQILLELPKVGVG